jgi:hypothetical protein
MTFISGALIPTTVPITTGVVEHATIALANTEQSHTFATGTQRFLLRARGSGKIFLSHSSGTSGTTGLTICQGAVYESPLFAPLAGRQIFFQSPVAGLVVEIESWS